MVLAQSQTTLEAYFIRAIPVDKVLDERFECDLLMISLHEWNGRVAPITNDEQHFRTGKHQINHVHVVRIHGLFIAQILDLIAHWHGMVLSVVLHHVVHKKSRGFFDCGVFDATISHEINKVLVLEDFFNKLNDQMSHFRLVTTVDLRMHV
jgi:hypothetical protein